MALTTDLDAVTLGDAAQAAFVLEPPRHVGLDATPLAAGKYLIGSADDCQIRLPVVGVQPHHALLIVGDRKTLLKAWDEKTWINDWPVKESVLRAGDRISIGPVTLRWRAVRADEIPSASPRRIDDDAPLVQELAPPAAVHLAAIPEQLPPGILPATVPPRPAINHDQQIYRERRLEELTQQLDARAAALQQEIERQAREWRERDAAWSGERRRAEDEFAARELDLLARRQEIEAWESRLASRENDLEDREAAWAANIAEIRSVWETTQREGEAKVAEQLAALMADAAACEQRQAELDELEQSLAERDLALAEAEREFEDRQAETSAASTVSIEEHELAVREFDERRTELNAEQQTLAEERAALIAERTGLDTERREFMARLAAADERQRQLDELQARLRGEQDDLTAARREIQTDRSAIEDDRAAIATERAALADEWESLATANIREAGSASDAANDALLAEQAALAEERAAVQAELAVFDEARAAFQAELTAFAAQHSAFQAELAAFTEAQTAFQTEQNDFDSRQRAWREEVEEHRLRAETIDRDLGDRQQQVAEGQARLEEDRRELHLKRADLDDAERRLQATIVERDAELLEAREKQTLFDERLAQWAVDQAELASARSGLDAAREAWQLETQVSRQELEARTLALSESEANLVDREAVLQAKIAALPVETTSATPAADAALPAEIERLNAELEREQEYRRTIESQLEGIRTRHERDAEHWHSERTDWMVERDRLERELQAATRQLSAQRSKPASSDAAPASPVPSHDAGLGEDMIADRYRDDASVENDPQWDSAHQDDAVADNWRDQPISAKFAAEADDPAENDDPLNHVRAELARMFDLSESALATPAKEIVSHQSPVIEEPPPVVLPPPEPEPSAPAPGDWQSRLESLRRQAEVEMPLPPVVEKAVVNEPGPVADEEDSIAQYMERMLARNRKSGEEPNLELASQPTIAVSRSSPASTSYAAPVEPELPVVEPAEDAAAESTRRRSPKPRVVPDKDAVREHLQVFRQVANASARTAVAKHTSRRMWMTVAAKGIVATVCVVAAASFLYASAVQHSAYHWQTLGCAIMGIVVGVDLLRMLYRTCLAVAKSKSSGQIASLATFDDESSELDDETADEVVSDV